VFPIILNRPYLSPGWLGLVPTGSMLWRTVDPMPVSGTLITDANYTPERLLGYLIPRAYVGGLRTRINLNYVDATDTTNTNPFLATTLKCIFDDTNTWANGRTTWFNMATSATAAPTPGWRPAAGWANWDELLNNTNVQTICSRATVDESGAGTIGDGFLKDSDETEEFARRYSNLVDLKTSVVSYVVSGQVYQDTTTPGQPVAQVRIQLDLDVSTTPIKVIHYRYLTEP
jgi:hypothetical protein